MAKTQQEQQQNDDQQKSERRARFAAARQAIDDLRQRAHSIRNGQSGTLADLDALCAAAEHAGGTVDALDPDGGTGGPGEEPGSPPTL